ncbi:MAG TPA: NDMA-dependent alcohol dehydrogenase [Polyangiaceae bacterium LLY-WYZ-14_1]|jgi:S-(hydroxymethyl)glutathione dehydrogenase/alcohol dehydrogenase|nr:NDMA-dependent alcohol dehydrogenase [Polyangiaceae bacterium LLY-WYZ-14_1]
MKIQAGVFYEQNAPFKVEELTLEDPKDGELLIKMAATGLCHSDYHMITGEYGPVHAPMVGGHEGAGVVEKVGPNTKGFEPGDHVLLTFLPTCGQCAYCSMGQGYICDNGAGILAGPQLDGTFRMRTNDGKDAGQFCLLGTFANYSVVPAQSAIKIDKGIDLTKICLMGCAIPTGYGSASKAAGTRVGETVLVIGIGGIGANALQGAVAAGASKVIAVDPVPFKREIAAEFGATHTIDPTSEDVLGKVMEITYNRGADRAVLTIGNPTPDDLGLAVNAIRKGGRVVATSVYHSKFDTLPISPLMFTLMAKELKGTLYGDSAQREDVPRYVEMYSQGKLKVDELVTKTYQLGQINDAYQDMLDGKNVRGVIIHEH